MMAALCHRCLQDMDTKAKPGIFPCIGCKKMFCTQHVASHRRELAHELELVINERNELQNSFDHRKDLPDMTPHLSIIDDWERETIEQVCRAADIARQHLMNKAYEQRIIIREKFTELSKQLNDMRENDNFFEQDVADMKAKCHRLKAAVNQMNININTTDVHRSLNTAITFQTTDLTKTEVLSYVENILKHQRPYKKIKFPHDGTLCLGEHFVLIKNQTDYTIVDFYDNSMRSISFETFYGHVYCWSSHHNGFFSKNRAIPEKIQFFSALYENHKYEMPIQNEGETVMIVSFLDNLLIIGNDRRNQTIIEEWCFVDTNRYQHKPSVKFVSRWHPPLSCSSDESIKQIAFDDQHIVLAIHNAKIAPKNRLEFRTRGMLVLGHLLLDDNVNFISITLVSMRDGWMFSQKRTANEHRRFTLIDRNFKEHRQKFLSSLSIETIAIFNDSLQGSSLAVYQKQPDAQTPTVGKQKFILNLYEMREDTPSKYLRRK